MASCWVLGVGYIPDVVFLFVFCHVFRGMLVGGRLEGPGRRTSNVGVIWVLMLDFNAGLGLNGC